MAFVKLERAISLGLEAGRPKIMSIAGVLVVAIAFADWAVGNTFSLGVLYILPMMVAAVALGTRDITLLGFFCAFLRSRFDTPGSQIETLLRFVFASLAYFTSGLFIIAILRNRDLVADHLKKIQKEQGLRSEAEEQLRVLVESSPAAILTLDSTGIVLAANNAANRLFAVSEGRNLQGCEVGNYLPILSDALRLRIGPEVFRTAAQCQGRRENGEIFSAHTWFSSYISNNGVRLAAIVVDSSEEMRDREEQNLRELAKYNRITAGAIAHEVRNVCVAASMLLSSVADKHSLAADDDYKGVMNLVHGLEKIASLNLGFRSQEALEEVPLTLVLDSLRIIIESEWQEMGGEIRWPAGEALPNVLADPHGLLQAFLNLVQNSYKAVQGSLLRELTITASTVDGRAFVRIKDSGPGVLSPDGLFKPFHSGGNGSGLGLYISRAILRSYGGDLRFEPQANGSCFLLELQVES